MLIALALSRSDLWLSWEGKVRILLTPFNPRMGAKGANEHESGWVLGRV